MELKEVFEPVVNFIKSLQKKDKEQASKQAAKDRLKLVLMQDRASVSPDFFELMKQEIIDVIKKYIEIDEESLEVQLTRGLEAGLEGPALYANIPIKNVKPVAPKSDNSEEGMTEKEAEEVAEQILNQIEEVAHESVTEIKQEDKETEKDNEKNSKIEKQKNNIKDKKEEKESTTAKTSKKTTKTENKKTTSSKSKKK